MKKELKEEIHRRENMLHLLKKYLENYDTLKTLKPFVKATKKSFVKKSTNYLKNLNILGDANVLFEERTS